MSFDLPAEYVELQASVRKLAREKVAPRAREIDTSATYPQDLFDVFRSAGLLGLVAPEEYGGGGAGVLGPWRKGDLLLARGSPPRDDE